MENRCVLCGEIIPEGRQVCPDCERNRRVSWDEWIVPGSKSEELAQKCEKTGKTKFTVIDTHTGEYPNLWSIARRCKWANHLVYCDMEGFALTEDGKLILMDECGGIAYCPDGRFKVVWENA